MVLALISAGYLIVGVMDRRLEARLIQRGRVVEATAFQVDTDQMKGRWHPPDSLVILHFPWNGQTYETHARRLEGRNEAIAVDSTIRIHVDPNDPDQWTPLDQPLPLLRSIFGAVMVLPVALLMFCASLWLYLGVMRLWHKGRATEALVVEIHISALAPLSRAARCTPAEENDRRVFQVFLPATTARPHPGDTLWVLCASGKSARAVAAAWFTKGIA
jgi:hypothetical protein